MRSPHYLILLQFLTLVLPNLQIKLHLFELFDQTQKHALQMIICELIPTFCASDPIGGSYRLSVLVHLKTFRECCLPPSSAPSAGLRTLV